MAVRLVVTHSPLQALARYRTSRLAGVPPIMRRSEGRLASAIEADTPVLTGHMRANLIKTSDIATVENEYSVLWRRQEFVGEINPDGQIIKEFYPAILILGGAEVAPRYPNLMTQEAQAEFPTLIGELRDHFEKVR